MGEKRQKLYKFISECAVDAVDNHSLNERILTRFPDISNKKIVKASVLAFTDRKLVDQFVFAKICDFAVSKRTVKLQDPVSIQSDAHDSERITGTSDQPVAVAETAEIQSGAAGTESVVVKLASAKSRRQKTAHQ